MPSMELDVSTVEVSAATINNAIANSCLTSFVGVHLPVAERIGPFGW